MSVCVCVRVYACVYVLMRFKIHITVELSIMVTFKLQFLGLNRYIGGCFRQVDYCI